MRFVRKGETVNVIRYTGGTIGCRFLENIGRRTV
jgi:hypothetical protein